MRVGTTPEERARWLWHQLYPSENAEKPRQAWPASIADRNEWVVFLEYAGFERNQAINLATLTANRKKWRNQIRTAIMRLKQGKQTEPYKVKMVRFWAVSDFRLTSRYGPVNQDAPEEITALVVSMAMDCLTLSCRVCNRGKCQEIFLANGKKKYCSHKCATLAAKKAYRKRKGVPKGVAVE